MNTEQPIPITEEDLQKRLQTLAGGTLDPRAGIYGPESMTWQLARHTALFWGSWRAVLLQLAHPWVAHAVCQHSRFQEDPLGRSHRTFQTVFKMTFGDLETALQAARGLHGLHTKIQGTLACPAGHFAGGTAYQANEGHALFWVHATLIDTTVLLYELTVRPLSPQEKAAYYEESKRTVCLFGIPDELVPPDWPSFLEYNRDMWASDTLCVGDAARTIADGLFRVRKMPSTWLMTKPARCVTRVLLPPRFRKAYGLLAPSPASRQHCARYLRWTRKVFAHLPAHLRYAPPYLEALQRLEGRPRGRVMTRLMNRLSVGQPELVLKTNGEREGQGDVGPIRRRKEINHEYWH
ncbi:MAG: oxygenase MpaB family protein [Verrucomicrobia bacterium]|nr:oxygenase MpaB family protein [Verrucomicrobiota bacterium]